MNRQNVFDYAKKKYGTDSDYPWSDNAAVLRHGDPNKHYYLKWRYIMGRLTTPLTVEIYSTVTVSGTLSTR